MAVPKSFLKVKGLWRGKSKLNLSHLPPEQQVTESNSSLHLETDKNETFATITYTWHQDGKGQEGSLLVCQSDSSQKVEVAWVDSWHQSTAVMHLVGTAAEDGSVKAKGSYSAGKQVWGWTIEIAPNNDHLTLKMENVMPNGKAEWAVLGEYKKDGN